MPVPAVLEPDGTAMLSGPSTPAAPAPPAPLYCSVLVDEASGGVVGVADEERGQIVKAYVVLRAGQNGDAAMARALQDYVKANIAPYKYPRAIEFVGDLPKNQTGKLQGFALRRQAAEQAAEQAAQQKAMEEEAKRQEAESARADREGRKGTSASKEPPNLIDQYLGSGTVKQAVNTAVRELTRSIFGTRKRR